MVFDEFIAEVYAIENPISREKYLSKLINQRTLELELAYINKSKDYLSMMGIDVRSSDLKSLVKAFNKLSTNQSKMMMILDNLVKDL